MESFHQTASAAPDLNWWGQGLCLLVFSDHDFLFPSVLLPIYLIDVLLWIRMVQNEVHVKFVAFMGVNAAKRKSGILLQALSPFPRRWNWGRHSSSAGRSCLIEIHSLWQERRMYRRVFPGAVLLNESADGASQPKADPAVCDGRQTQVPADPLRVLLCRQRSTPVCSCISGLCSANSTSTSHWRWRCPARQRTWSVWQYKVWESSNTNVSKNVDGSWCQRFSWFTWCPMRPSPALLPSFTESNTTLSCHKSSEWVVLNARSRNWKGFSGKHTTCLPLSMDSMQCVTYLLLDGLSSAAELEFVLR